MNHSSKAVKLREFTVQWDASYEARAARISADSLRTSARTSGRD
ncbi:hypothetical protein VOM14_08770 [Paraburkholderia sp. MPAMCS5]|nr:hypothetical protein [Paraburkholderia sp. MPAMCS5]